MCASLQVEVSEGGKAQLDANSFGVTGLKLNGAVCKSNTLSLSATIQTDLPTTLLRWIRYHYAGVFHARRLTMCVCSHTCVCVRVCVCVLQCTKEQSDGVQSI